MAATPACRTPAATRMHRYARRSRSSSISFRWTGSRATSSISRARSAPARSLQQLQRIHDDVRGAFQRAAAAMRPGTRASSYQGSSVISSRSGAPDDPFESRYPIRIRPLPRSRGRPRHPREAILRPLTQKSGSGRGGRRRHHRARPLLPRARDRRSDRGHVRRDGERSRDDVPYGLWAGAVMGPRPTADDEAG